MDGMRKTGFVALLLLVLLPVAGWQALEHRRAEQSARRLLTNRARDLAAAMSVVVRSQGRLAIVPRARLEEALGELVREAELDSVALLSASGDVVAAAGAPVPGDFGGLLRTREHWERDRAFFTHLVALGAGVEGLPGILPMEDGGMPGPGGRPPFHGPPPGPPPGHPPGPEPGGNIEHFLNSPFLDPVLDQAGRRTLLGMLDGAPLTAEQVEALLALFKPGILNDHRAETLRRTLTGRAFDREALRDTLLIAAAPVPKPGPPPDQPPWMGREEYDRLARERGVMWFLVGVPTKSVQAEVLRDLRLRGIVLAVTALACAALAWAWLAAARSADLEIALVRSRETESHLKDLSVTAAGLVHETKNPLNLIRGLAQMIGRDAEVPVGTRRTAVKITEEADRVTGRINQFLDYARPVRPDPRDVDLAALVRGLFEVLACDREEKAVTLSLEGPETRVCADENMLRQVLFNLVLNAVQAVPPGGRVTVRVLPDGRGARVQVRDTGPGVPDAHREEVFRPYFTASEQGTGLGLAIVRQIALAHQWRVACLPNDGGAVFEVAGLAPARGRQEEAPNG